MPHDQWLRRRHKAAILQRRGQKVLIDHLANLGPDMRLAKDESGAYTPRPGREPAFQDARAEVDYRARDDEPGEWYGWCGIACHG